MKPYSTKLGEPVRLLVMTEKMYNDKKDAAQRLMKCFVESTSLFNKDPALAEKYVREQLFKGQLTIVRSSNARSAKYLLLEQRLVIPPPLTIFNHLHA